MIKFKKNLIFIILILISVSSFIYGFSIRENSAGGGEYDFRNTWNNQKVFNENTIVESLKNTKTSEIDKFINSHFPFSYILNKLINPYSKNKESFLKSIFILNFFLPIIFFLILKNIFVKKNIYLLACFSSIIYLSPYFRTSSYWAGMENYGLFMMLFSFYFFSRYLKIIKNELQTKKNLYIILFSFFSCLCVYFDQKFLLFPIIYMYYFFKNEKNNQSIILYLVTNIILSIPVLTLVYYWGGVITPHDLNSRNFGNIYLEQIGYTFSIIFFYLIPYIITNIDKIILYIKDNIIKFVYLSFLTIIFYLLLHFFPTEYFQWGQMGRGWLHKLSLIISDSNILQKIFVYSFFYLSLVAIFAVSQNRYLLISFTIFFCFISLLILPIFQEYFDPLLFIFLSLFFYNNDELNEKFIKVHYLFSMVFLIFSNLYY